jgi:hypothetical protein
MHFTVSHLRTCRFHGDNGFSWEGEAEADFQTRAYTARLSTHYYPPCRNKFKRSHQNFWVMACGPRIRPGARQCSFMYSPQPDADRRQEIRLEPKKAPRVRYRFSTRAQQKTVSSRETRFKAYLGYFKFFQRSMLGPLQHICAFFRSKDRCSNSSRNSIATLENLEMYLY